MFRYTYIVQWNLTHQLVDSSACANRICSDPQVQPNSLGEAIRTVTTTEIRQHQVWVAVTIAALI